MKLPLFLFISLLPLSFADQLPNPTSDGAEKLPVLDAHGEKLQAGIGYFIFPVTTVSGGGLSPAKVNENHTACALHHITQKPDDDQTGLPVAISLVNGGTGSVPLSTDVNLQFFAPKVCSNESVWRVGKYDEQQEKFFIFYGGEEGNSGPETLSERFKIEKHEPGYKFSFCPSVTGTSQIVCQDVGVFIGATGDRFLALSETPLIVRFKTAPPFPPGQVPPFPPAPVHPAPLPPVPVHPAPLPPTPAPPAPDASSAFVGSKSIFLAFGSLMLCFF